MPVKGGVFDKNAKIIPLTGIFRSRSSILISSWRTIRMNPMKSQKMPYTNSSKSMGAIQHWCPDEFRQFTNEWLKNHVNEAYKLNMKLLGVDWCSFLNFALFPMRVVYEGCGAAAHGVRDNRSPMQASARTRCIGKERPPMTSRPEGATKNTAFTYPYGEQSLELSRLFI